MKFMQDITAEIEEKSQELTDNFLKKLQEIALKEGPQNRPYYLIHSVTPDITDEYKFVEGFVISFVKPPYHPELMILAVDPIKERITLEEEYIHEDPHKQKTVITANDVTHIDKAIKTIRKG